MKSLKYIGVLLLSILLLTNCQKDNKKDDNATGEITFAALDGNTEKDGIYDILCDENLNVVYARVKLNDTYYYPETFVLNDMLYTQSLKLAVGNYTVNEFSLMDDMGTPDDMTDDEIVKATPMSTSDYAMYVTAGIGDLPVINVGAFEKTEFPIDVLCYTEAAYTAFGFEWFVITELTIREQCFFGDFCIKDPNQYTGSLYGPDVVLDEVAIFKIVAFRKVGNDWVNIKDVTNPLGEAYYNTYYDDNNVLQYMSPLCVEYADYDVGIDQFKFELWIYVTLNDGWGYVKFHEWEFDDAEMIDAGVDGVVDFVLGNCVYDDPDLLLPPWMNLPVGGDYSFALSNGGPTGDSYWDVTIGGISSPNFDMVNGTFEGWCADEGTTIGNGTHCMDAMSSLYPKMLPPYWLDLLPPPNSNGDTPLTREEALCATNWLWNNQQNYTYTTAEMQNALWNLFNNKAVSGIAKTMADDARGNCDFSPLPGGWAAILFVPCNDELQLQMTFFVVDP
jgi:hypothetical protein